MTDGDTTTVTYDRLQAFLAEMLVRLGAPEDQAQTIATSLAEADLRGVESHGANMMAMYVARVRAGSLQPKTSVTVVQDSGATAILDGGLGFGQVAGVQAIDLAMEKARTHGVAVVTVRESAHLGALGYYTLRAAEAGFFAMAFQNGPPVVPPYGGLSPMFSTNPFSYAAPAGRERTVVLDMATTTVAGNKLILARKRGDTSMPPGWAVDERGRPTTDPFAALKGHLQWAGGYKGYGLAMLVEILAGVLAGGSYGHTDIPDIEPHGKERVIRSHFFLAVNIERFMPLAEFKQRMDQLIGELHDSLPAEGFERVYVPGEPEHLRRAARLRDGIPLATAVVRELNEIGASLAMEPLAGP